MSHELGAAVQSGPVMGDPLYRGAFVTKAILDGQGNVLSAERAYDTIYNENTLVGPAPEVGNTTRAFSRFCSGSLAGPDQGFDRCIYLTNEEEGTPANSFDGLGGLAVATFDTELHTLPRLGRSAWEQTIVQPGKGGKDTVILNMEDGPANLAPGVENSQVYMYVGTKDKKSPTVLGKNGLDHGELYVLAPVSGASDESAFLNGSIPVKWVVIPNAGTLDEAGLEAASDAAGAFRFARPDHHRRHGHLRTRDLAVRCPGASAHRGTRCEHGRGRAAAGPLPQSTRNPLTPARPRLSLPGALHSPREAASPCGLPLTIR